ncbi:hypothetical protein ACWEOE_29345 [Amycolatopsis sp. NPDC004368]
MIRKATKRKLGRLWGYLVLAAVGCCWFVPSVGPAAIAIMSGLVVLYCLFQAPMWCCAPTRANQLCRNNANGILLGCHLRQHKFEKLKLAVRQQAWSRAAATVLTSIGGKAASLSALAGMVSAGVATVTLVVK